MMVDLRTQKNVSYFLMLGLHVLQFFACIDGIDRRQYAHECRRVKQQTSCKEKPELLIRTGQAVGTEKEKVMIYIVAADRLNKKKQHEEA